MLSVLQNTTSLQHRTSEQSKSCDPKPRAVQQSAISKLALFRLPALRAIIAFSGSSSILKTSHLLKEKFKIVWDAEKDFTVRQLLEKFDAVRIFRPLRAPNEFMRGTLSQAFRKILLAELPLKERVLIRESPQKPELLCDIEAAKFLDKRQKEGEDHALRTLAYWVVRKENPSIPIHDVAAIREWFKEPANQVTLQNITEIKLLGSDFTTKLTVIPKEIQYFTNLENLQLSNNEIDEIPPEIAHLVNLRTLNLSNNKISMIPSELTALVNLEKLRLGQNLLSEISPEITGLINLKSLDLYSNKISEIPLDIGNLENLTHFELQHNQIAVIPKEIASLVNLTCLNLHHNQIREIPKELGSLVNLSSLDVSDNHISKVPAEVAQLPILFFLRVLRNPIPPSNMPVLTHQADVLRRLTLPAAEEPRGLDINRRVRDAYNNMLQYSGYLSNEVPQLLTYLRNRVWANGTD